MRFGLCNINAKTAADGDDDGPLAAASTRDEFADVNAAEQTSAHRSVVVIHGDDDDDDADDGGDDRANRRDARSHCRVVEYRRRRRRCGR